MKITLFRLWAPLILSLALIGCGPAGGKKEPKDTSADATSDAGGSDATVDAGSDVPAGDAAEDADAGLEDVPGDADAGQGDVGPEDGVTDDGNEDTTPDDVSVDAVADAPDDVTLPDAASDVAEDAAQDIGPPLEPCLPECGPTEVCANGLCLLDCGEGFDAIALEASLGDGVQVLGSICGSESFSFVALSASSFMEIGLFSGSPTSQMQLTQIDYNDPEAFPQFLTAGELAGSIDGGEAYPNDYLSIDLLKTRAIFGYVSSFAQGMGGTIFLADLTQPGLAPLGIEAPGHFRATLVDSSTLLVNGQGAAGISQGPGIYRVKVVEGQATAHKVVTNLGIGGGVVGVHGSLVLFTGHADPWPSECGGVPVANTIQGTRVFVTGLDAINQAVETGQPVDAFCKAQALALPPSLRFHPTGDILGRDVEAGNYLTRYQWTKLANGVVFLTGTKILADGPAISDGRGVVGSNLVVLSHSHGYLIVQ